MIFQTSILVFHVIFAGWFHVFFGWYDSSHHYIDLWLFWRWPPTSRKCSFIICRDPQTFKKHVILVVTGILGGGKPPRLYSCQVVLLNPSHIFPGNSGIFHLLEFSRKKTFWIQNFLQLWFDHCRYWNESSVFSKMEMVNPYPWMIGCNVHSITFNWAV